MYRSANNTKAQLRRDPNCIEVKGNRDDLNNSPLLYA